MNWEFSIMLVPTVNSHGGDIFSASITSLGLLAMGEGDPVWISNNVGLREGPPAAPLALSSRGSFLDIGGLGLVSSLPLLVPRTFQLCWMVL
jgi:hypothetical protein